MLLDYFTERRILSHRHVPTALHLLKTQMALGNGVKHWRTIKLKTNTIRHWNVITWTT